MKEGICLETGCESELFLLKEKCIDVFVVCLISTICELAVLEFIRVGQT
jgi:hypothetical protein